MDRLLNNIEVGIIAEDIEKAQQEMLNAINKWNKAKSAAIDSGLELHTFESTDRRRHIFPVQRVTYTPKVEVELRGG